MNTLFARTLPVRLVAFLVAALSLGAVGCGKRTGDLEGHVTLNGAPFIKGMVHVCSVDETGNVLSTTSAAIEADGSYAVNDVPVGPTRVLVQGPPFVYPMSKPPPGWRQPVDPVPARYRSLETTSLTPVVAGGTQQFDIDLTD